jgi:hypothetical protein
MSTVIPFDLDNRNSYYLESFVCLRDSYFLSNPKIYLIFRVLGVLRQACCKHHACMQCYLMVLIFALGTRCLQHHPHSLKDIFQKRQENPLNTLYCCKSQIKVNTTDKRKGKGVIFFHMKIITPLRYAN